MVDKIIETWIEKINASVSRNALKRIINTLVHDNGYEEQYILYLVLRGASEGWLHYPPGLYKVVGEKRFLNDFENKKAEQKIKNITQEEVGGYEVDQDFEFNNKHKRGFSRIYR